mmetsp:Transcript_17210/g.24086  ORF Transcript_17210/g.24086 Transcript_17210/m.24086 type:complete len:80 (+) Transcript_17210:786-1025(+)
MDSMANRIGFEEVREQPNVPWQIMTFITNRTKYITIDRVKEDKDHATLTSYIYWKLLTPRELLYHQILFRISTPFSKFH